MHLTPRGPRKSHQPITRAERNRRRHAKREERRARTSLTEYVLQLAIAETPALPIGEFHERLERYRVARTNLTRLRAGVAL